MERERKTSIICIQNHAPAKDDDDDDEEEDDDEDLSKYDIWNDDEDDDKDDSKDDKVRSLLWVLRVGCWIRIFYFLEVSTF